MLELASGIGLEQRSNISWFPLLPAQPIERGAQQVGPGTGCNIARKETNCKREMVRNTDIIAHC
jgi:hypothetical protein